MLRLILALSILPIIRTNLSWLYLLQLKEYRRDRIKDFLRTKEWKKYVFSKRLFIYLILFSLLFLSSILFKISFHDWTINSHIKIWYILFIITAFVYLILWIDSLYFFYKILKKTIKLPKKTSRLLLVLSSTFILQIAIIFLDLKLDIWWSFFILNIIFSYLILFMSNLLTSPIINYQKKQTYLKASEKLKTYKDLIWIWITWSYWKSSVKTLLNELLSTEFKTFCTTENINTEIWVSNLILKNNFEDKKYFVCEMWAYRIWEIETLWDIVNHKYWFLTWIGNQHIWLFGSQENIIKWKLEIIKSVIKNNGKLYINGNVITRSKVTWQSHWKIELIDMQKHEKYMITYWLDTSSNAYSFIKKICTTWKSETEFQFIYWDKKYDLTTNLIGDHNILNLTWVLAFLVDQWINLNSENIKNKLLNLSKPKNTLEVIEKENLILIDDSYNLSIDALWAWVDFLKYFKGEKILVLDDVLELWKESEKIHFEIGEKLAKSDLKYIVLVWKNYREHILKWFLESWGDTKKVIKDLSKYISKDFLAKNLITILFEWRETKKLLNKIKI